MMNPYINERLNPGVNEVICVCYSAHDHKFRIDPWETFDIFHNGELDTCKDVGLDEDPYHYMDSDSESILANIYSLIDPLMIELFLLKKDDMLVYDKLGGLTELVYLPF